MYTGAWVKARALSGLLLAFAVGLTACSPAAQQAAPGGDSERAPAERPRADTMTLEEPGQRGGKFTMTSNNAFANPNDPHLVSTAFGRNYAIPATNSILRRNIYDPGIPIIADLAEKWETSKDGLTYTFKLREGVKFHNVPPVNGREMTSADAKYSLQRITADPSVVPEKNRPRFQRRLDFGSIKSIETPDRYTLVVTLKEPYAPFLDAMAHSGTIVLPKEFVDKFEAGFILEGMIGTGPYMPTEYKNQVISSYKRNPDYWKKDSKGNQLPYLDEVSLLYFADSQAELASFRARQIDATTSADFPQASVESVKKGDPNVKVFVTPKTNMNTLRFNMKFKPFQDLRVRRAIHLAVDRHQFLELVSGGRGVVVGPVTPIYKDFANTTDWLLSQPGYRKDKKADLEEAKRLLKEAGYGDGLSVGAIFSTGATYADFASLLIDQLKAVGVTLKVEQMDYAGQWLPRMVQGEFELSHLVHGFAADADSVLSAHLHSKGGRNYGKFVDTKLDELIDKQRTAVTVEERRKWVQETEKYILDADPMLFIYASSFVLMAQPWTHNVTDGPVQGMDVESVDRAWVEKH